MPQPSRQARDSSGYLAEDTIAAILTALGGAVAVLRVSGPEARPQLEALAGKGFLEGKSPRVLYRALLKDSAGRPVDDALVSFFAAPRSFTGEDVVEFHVHGGSYIATRLLTELLSLGARQALPGEFSFRAVRNGKMTLSQAEAVADLIGAQNDSAVSLAIEKLGGAQGRFVSELAEELRNFATLGEVGIDFADQDVEEVSLPSLKKRLDPLMSRLGHLAESFSRGARIQDGVGVAFVGLPNAGKSSFFNSLLGEDRSIVSEIAGTTRDVVRERLTLRGTLSSVTLRLEDTAGLRHSEDKVEQIGIQRTQKAARDADLVLLVVDASLLPEEEKALRKHWDSLGSPKNKTLGVLTKTDLVTAGQLAQTRQKLGNFGIPEWLETSAATGRGIPQAATRIADFCEKWVHRDPGEILLTRMDHVESVRRAIEHLERAKDAPEIDLFASDVRQALMALSGLIGETVPDDILGRIFSKFCIGK